MKELQFESLTRAVSNQSTANYKAIIDGFLERGIEVEEIKPRENVFTFNAWKALGRVVKKGERGIAICTVIHCKKIDPETGEEKDVSKPQKTRVFHISQTQLLSDPQSQPEAQPEAHMFKGIDFPLPENISGKFSFLTSVSYFDSYIYAELLTGHRVQIGKVLNKEHAQKLVDDLNHHYAYISDEIAAQKAARLDNLPSSYEQRLEEKRDRLESRALKSRRLSNEAYEQSHRLTEMIPFGQPILVGHHSERRHRAALDKSWNKMGQSVALSEKAEYYARRAAAVGSAGISSDDPSAIEKLEEKLAKQKKAHSQMIAANKVIRSKSDDESKRLSLFEIGFSEASINASLKPDCMGVIGFASYQLTNSNQRIKATEKRLNELKKIRTIDVPDTQEFNGFSVTYDMDENRILIKFDAKPSAEICKLMRRYSFKFSPTRNNSWVRKITGNALAYSKYLIADLQKAF
ncbi:DUF3560 domain-containing protein [Yersinia kristensenii]|uniref:N-terminal domain-containing protein n=1 Tax=Yersinia kristensenii TaxID=28152 RepID=A0AB73NGI8_YERKR|nr:DUF3560 domain-containing protein [Yersinia kristensenii]OVZ77671.1 hypothetical protein CBW52_20165 [Yersinia kristensenii]